ncbi:MAG: UvrB/UvrC motif-containing protein [Anaerolineae bacterium]
MMDNEGNNYVSPTDEGKAAEIVEITVDDQPEDAESAIDRAIDQIRQMLQDAIEEQNFERAAYLRDQLRNVEKVQLEPAREAFLEIALNRGVEISFNEPDTILLDMNLIAISIRNAIQRCESDRVAEKLRELLEAGTDADRISFVMGDGTYYFPNDLQAIAESSRHGEGEACQYFAEYVCFTVCETRPDGSHDCADKCRKVVDIVC